jgi:hypothetical protein
MRLITSDYNLDVNIEYYVYANSKQNCMKFTVKDGQPFATASRSVNGLTEIGKRNILIKNTDECVGFLNCLIKNKIVKNTGIKIRAGHYNVHLCEIIDPNFKRA